MWDECRWEKSFSITSLLWPKGNLRWGEHHIDKFDKIEIEICSSVFIWKVTFIVAITMSNNLSLTFNDTGITNSPINILGSGRRDHLWPETTRSATLKRWQQQQVKGSHPVANDSKHPNVFHNTHQTFDGILSFYLDQRYFNNTDKIWTPAK